MGATELEMASKPQPTDLCRPLLAAVNVRFTPSLEDICFSTLPIRLASRPNGSRERLRCIMSAFIVVIGSGGRHGTLVDLDRGRCLRLGLLELSMEIPRAHAS